MKNDHRINKINFEKYSRKHHTKVSASSKPPIYTIKEPEEEENQTISQKSPSRNIRQGKTTQSVGPKSKLKLQL